LFCCCRLPHLELPLTLQSIAAYSCTSSGTYKDTFGPAEIVYVWGYNFNPSQTITIYVVPNGDPYDAAHSIYNTAVTTSSSGKIWPPKSLGTFPPGEYDIWIDTHGNLFRMDEPADGFGCPPGFLVMPEYWLGTILGLGGCFAALGVFRTFKLKRNRP